MRCPCCDTELHALVQATTDNEMILACENCREECCSRVGFQLAIYDSGQVQTGVHGRMAKPVNDNDKPICELPPVGWFCSREPGHEGPCAAHDVRELYEDAMCYRDLCR